jgi:hypothetical protein
MGCLVVECSRRRAAEYVGVAESTIRAAAKQDEAFNQRLLQASVALEADCLRRIRDGDKMWRSAAWLLEKKMAHRYSGNAKSAEIEERRERDEKFAEADDFSKRVW